ncbi:archease [Nostoc sp. 106C]|uniref:archease n=1 Tax=Nostoc sp. 106C TaxID=1932667 RepID=UPI000A3B198F|nr:archease [Nostoc sp. 106C]OUL23728.1 protein archease [Nostoc sp. 106C]
MQSPDFLNSLAGFEEVEHTADWAYRVWGQNLADLFIQAANGLYAIASVQRGANFPVSRNIQLHGVDYESLLVAWLNELLYLHESEGLGFNRFEILHLDRHNLQAKVSGAPVKNSNKLIKAVTYNNLAIQTTEKGLEATLVLDV